MPTESTLPGMAPAPTVDNAPFWSALTEDQIRLPRCQACGYVIWYPRHHCPECGAGRDRIEWVDASGRGRVYSYTVVRRNRGPWGEVLPYVVAYVELDEGPRVMTNIVFDGTDLGPDDVTIDLAVEAVFHAVASADGEDAEAAVLRFRPSS